MKKIFENATPIMIILMMLIVLLDYGFYYQQPSNIKVLVILYLTIIYMNKKQ